MEVTNEALFYGAIAIVLAMLILSGTTKMRIYNLMSIPALLVIGVLTYESVPFLIFVIGMIMFQIWYAMVKP
jgi:hypothetical protein